MHYSGIVVVSSLLAARKPIWRQSIHPMDPIQGIESHNAEVNAWKQESTHGHSSFVHFLWYVNHIYINGRALFSSSSGSKHFYATCHYSAINTHSWTDGRSYHTHEWLTISHCHHSYVSWTPTCRRTPLSTCLLTRLWFTQFTLLPFSASNDPIAAWHWIKNI